MARILITGGAGFIGSHLVAAGVAAGHEVHAVLRPGSDERRLRGVVDRITRHAIDLREEGRVRLCVASVQPERIYHLAASPRRPEAADLGDARAWVEDDLGSLIRLLAAAAEARHPPRSFVRTGSLAEYGAAPAPYREDRRETPLGIYGAGMVAATHLCATLQRRLPFPVVTARLALTYGPAQSTDYLLPLLIRRCLAGEETRIRHPLDRRDLIHVDDVVDALLRIGAVPLPEGAIVNVATGTAPTMRRVAGLVTRATGTSPDLVTFGEGESSSGTRDLRGSTARARRMLGWSARIPLSEGIARTVAWFRAETAPPPARAGGQRSAQIPMNEVSP